MKEKRQFDRFKCYSEMAAKQERQGEYAEAVEAWHIASLNAKNEANLLWCHGRKAICERLARRGF